MVYVSLALKEAKHVIGNFAFVVLLRCSPLNDKNTGFRTNQNVRRCEYSGCYGKHGACVGFQWELKSKQTRRAGVRRAPINREIPHRRICHVT